MKKRRITAPLFLAAIVAAVEIARAVSDAPIAHAQSPAPPSSANPASASSAPKSTAPTPPPLVPPRATSIPRIPYPQTAHGDAVVVVELVVTTDGTVRDPKIVDGKEPFASAALSAAPTWTFTPARRGEVNVSAKIRMRVEFTEPKPIEEPAAASDGGAPAQVDGGAATTSATPGTKTNVEEVEQVEVFVARKEVGATTLGGGEVRQIPGAFGDAFRAMEAMPGVVPIFSGLPFFYVRGAPPGNTGYFIDGVRVPLLYHLGLGPSVIHPGLIDHVDFYPGGFPARLGRFTGGILSGEILPPATDLHGEGNVRFIDAGALIETPIGPNLTVLAAGRYSYTALLLTIAAAITGNHVRLDYWDYQTRVAYKVTPKDTVSVFAFGSFDYLGADSDGKFQDLFQTQFHRVDLRWDHKLEDGRMRVAATVGYDLTGAGSTLGLSDTMLASRFELEKKLSQNVRFRMGTDAIIDNYATQIVGNSNGGAGNSSSPGDTSSDRNSIIPPRKDLAMGMWFDIVYKPVSRVEIIPGIRFDYYGSEQDSFTGNTGATANSTSGVGSSVLNGGGTGLPAVDPRLATRIKLTPWLTSIEQVAVAHQPPSFLVPVPGLQIGRLQGGLQASYTISQGFELSLPYEITFAPTVFTQSYTGLTDFITSCTNTPASGGSGAKNGTDDCFDQRVHGRSYGLEVLLRRPLTKRFTGFVSYTLSQTTRETNGLSNFIDVSKIPGGAAPNLDLATRTGYAGTIPGEFDRRHVLNVIGAFDLGAGWRAGTRLVYYTGTPYTQTIGGVPVPPFNNMRLPDFWRIDARLEKKWHVGKHGYLTAVLEWMNVTLQKEAFPDPSPCSRPAGWTGLYDQCTPQMFGPVTIPSLGLEGGF